MATRADENLLSVGIPESQSSNFQYFVHGTSPAMRAVERTIADIADTDIPVLLVGESGTGKEVLALEIHRQSRRRSEPFVKCGCSGITADSLSARMRRTGRASDSEANCNGSLFLDGINYLELTVQERLLHLRPDCNAIASQGGDSLRVISSTTRNLEEEMKSGRFREELYYRINGVHLRLPPLRERREDIPALLEFFFKKYTSLFERPEPRLGEPTLSLLLRHSWPGNIRELENVARKIVALGDEHLATHELAAGQESRTAESAPPVPRFAQRSSPAPTGSLKAASRAASRVAERAMILSQLERTHWNRKKAARELQISYKALLYKLKQLGLDGSEETERQ